MKRRSRTKIKAGLTMFRFDRSENMGPDDPLKCSLYMDDIEWVYQTRTKSYEVCFIWTQVLVFPTEKHAGVVGWEQCVYDDDDLDKGVPVHAHHVVVRRDQWDWLHTHLSKDQWEAFFRRFCPVLKQMSDPSPGCDPTSDPGSEVGIGSPATR